ncbi:WxL domain-containing protein [Enterococcus sp. 1001283B150225_161107_E12]|uniref:WxL domain-containing protein n=1 Tax=Enterococcus sp. 1001283B150225_161107_E12 TaxID=2787145 RepID=UPI00189CCB93|nr:WxL domain-containing protein [Enterococcus sp. 1001283B150225_161107_E12]
MRRRICQVLTVLSVSSLTLSSLGGSRLVYGETLQSSQMQRQEVGNIETTDETDPLLDTGETKRLTEYEEKQNDQSSQVEEELATGSSFSMYNLDPIPFPPNTDLTATSIDSFPKLIRLDNSGQIVSGFEFLPQSETYLVNQGSSATFLNDRRITNSAAEGNGTVFRVGDIIRFENVGIGANDRPFHAIYEVLRQGNNLAVHAQGFSSSNVGSGPRRSAVFLVHFEYADGSPVEGSIAMSLGGTANPTLTTLEENMYAVATSSNVPRWGQIDPSVLSARINMGTMNVFIPAEPHVQAWSAFNISSVSLFQQHGPELDVFYNELDVIGDIEEEAFVSRYKVSQRIPSASRPGDRLNIQVDNPDILKASDAQILSVKDDTGTDLSEVVTVTQTAEQLTFGIDDEALSSLRGKTIDIELEYPIDKEKSPSDFLVGDYLEVDLEVSNSQSSTIATGTAKTWARPWGDPVPQEVGQGLSTADLDPKELVENLANKLVGDEPFVVGFSEEKTFDTLGDTTVDVIIESQISGIQNTIAVPVKVIEADVVLTVEFMNEINQLLSDYTVVMDGKIGDVVDLTTEPLVLEQMQALDQAGYEIVTRPENESSFTLTQTEMIARYQVTGLLRLTSAPSALDFGSLTYNARTQRVEKPTFDQEKEPLLVTDTRASADSGWTMMATLSSPLVNEDDQELFNALRYVFEGEETILDTNALIVHRQNDAQRLFNVSDTWGDTRGSDGLKLQIGARDVVHTGNYQGTITWTLMAGQP